MKNLMKIVPIIGALAFSQFSFSSDIELGRPGYGGNGCPAGSASAVLSPDRKSLSILFDEFAVEAGGRYGRTLARKSCNLAIPVRVPNGLSVSIIDIDYRGYNYLPRGANATFNAEYFFAGRRGPRYRKVFRGYTDAEYHIENPIAVASMVWSRCGEDVNLRVNASMRVRNRNRREEAVSTVDSADFRAGIIYRLAFRRCR
jgi:hypothetical protein